MSYEVKIDAFQGPIDLLWHLLQKDELEIYDIKISEITNQYLDYIATMQRLDLDVASEFLIMAARLMEIKAQTLLPSPNDEDTDVEDPRQKLVERLLEYKKYKDLATELRDFEQQQRKSYTRNVAPLLEKLEFEEESPLEDIKLDQFVAAFEQVLTRRKKRKKEEALAEERQKITHLEPENVTVQEQKGYIMQQIVKLDGAATLWQIFSKLESKLEVIVTFMSLLELIKIEEIKIEQENNFAEVSIYQVESGKE
ncbi:MAG: segregation and condensation protein A [Bacillota bacterium]